MELEKLLNGLSRFIKSTSKSITVQLTLINKDLKQKILPGLKNCTGTCLKEHSGGRRQGTASGLTCYQKYCFLFIGHRLTVKGGGCSRRAEDDHVILFFILLLSPHVILFLCFPTSPVFLPFLPPIM